MAHVERFHVDAEHEGGSTAHRGHCVALLARYGTAVQLYVTASRGSGNRRC